MRINSGFDIDLDLRNDTQVRVGPWQRPNPRRFPSLAAWYDTLDTTSMLSSAGTVVTAGASVALWSDKSGRSSVNCASFDGAASNYISTVSSANYNSSAGFTAEIEISHPTWTPASSCYMFGRWTDGTNRCWIFSINTGSKLVLQVTADGATIATSAISTTALSSLFSAFQIVRLRVTYLADNGAGGRDTTFSYSLNSGASWTVIDSTITQATATPIFDGNSMLSIGALAGGGSPTGSAGMKVYYAKFTNSSDEIKAVFDPSTAGKLATSLVSVTGETWNINSSGATGVHISGARDLYQGTAANRPTYLPWSGSNYGWLNGVAGNYFSTPDSVASSIGVRFAMACDTSRADWSPAAAQVLMSKRTAGQYTFLFYLNTNGTLEFAISTDGTATAGTFTSSVALADVTNARYFVGVEADLDNGAGSSVSFYTSSDEGATWDALGDTQTNVSAFTPFNATSALEVGSQISGTAGLATASFYRAFITASTLTAAKTVDFNPSLYTSGPTFTAATGEVWTVNGGAHIVTRTGLYFDGSNDYLKSPAFSLSQPVTMCGVLSEITRTANDIICDGGVLNGLRYSQAAGATTDYLTSNAVNFLNNTAMPVLNTCFALTAVFNDATSRLRANRAAAATGSVGAVAPLGFTLGAGTSGGSPANVFVSDITLFTAALDQATQDRLVLNAGRKWRLSV